MPESSYSKHFWIHPMTMKNPLQRCGLSRKENQIPPNTRKQIWLVKSSFPDLFLMSKRFLQILKFDAECCFSFHLQTHPKKNHQQKRNISQNNLIPFKVRKQQTWLVNLSLFVSFILIFFL